MPGKVRKMAKAIRHTRMGEKCKQEQLMSDTFGSTAKGRVRETRTAKITQVLF